MSYCCLSKDDRYRLYNALLSFKTLPDCRYLGGIYIKKILSRFTSTKAFTALSFKISRSKFMAIANSIYRDIITRVVARVRRSWFYYWLPHTISLALHIWKFLYLPILYINTYWYPNTWYLFTFWWLTSFHDFNCFCCSCIWFASFFQ